MPEKDPMSYSWGYYAFIVGLSFWGGFAQYLKKVRMGQTKPFSIVEAIGEMTVSGFAGIITFFLCEASDMSPLLSAAFAGISGHMGSRSLFMIERYIQSKFSSIIAEEDDSNKQK